MIPVGYATAVAVNAFIAGVLVTWVMLRPGMRRLRDELEAVREMHNVSRGIRLGLGLDVSDPHASIAPRWPDG